MAAANIKQVEADASKTRPKGFRCIESPLLAWEVVRHIHHNDDAARNRERKLAGDSAVASAPLSWLSAKPA